MLLATWFLVCFFKRFRSFVAENLESVGQRAAKLPAIKLWEWFEGAGVRTRAHWLTGAGAGWQTFLRPPTLTASNFAALWPTEPKFSASKHLIFFKRFRSFNAKNLGSVGQRAAKLLAVKVGGLKKGLPAGPGPSQPVCPGSNPCAFKSFSKFDGWYFCSPLTYRPQIFSIERSKPL